MGAEPWLNYFNYFTEVEEHFQRSRGSGLFLLSTLDWALIETWKNSGVPLDAVLRGITTAFETWRNKKGRKLQLVNSMAYCAQAVMAEAEAMANAGVGVTASSESPFPPEMVRAHIQKSCAALPPEFAEVAQSLAKLLDEFDTHFADLQALDQRLTALEEKLAAIARSRMSDDDLFEARRQLDHQLKPYRGKMTTEQLSLLERKYLDRMIFDRAALPRLSLFYMQ